MVGIVERDGSPLAKMFLLIWRYFRAVTVWDHGTPVPMPYYSSSSTPSASSEIDNNDDHHHPSPLSSFRSPIPLQQHVSSPASALDPIRVAFDKIGRPVLKMTPVGSDSAALPVNRL